MSERSLSSWLYPKPTSDPGRDRNARTLQFASLLAAFAIATTAVLNTILRQSGETPLLLFGLAGVLAAAAMNRMGRWEWAARLAILGILLTAILLVEGARDGFRSHAMLLFPGILVIAVMLLDRASYMATAAVVLIAVTALGIAEMHGIGLVVPPVRTPTSYSAIISVGLNLLVFALIGSRIARDNQRNVLDLRTTINRLSAANFQLQAYANALRESDQSLRQSEELFRSLFENVNVGFYRTTPDGQILIANPFLLRLLGYDSFAELAGRNLEKDAFEPVYSRSHFRDLLESQDAIAGLEFLWKRRNGSTVFLRENARTVRAEDGKVLFYDGVVEDFTERKRSEDALRESEERFRNIADTCPAIIWYGDTNLQITFLNKQAAVFSGRNPEELLGTAWAEHVHPDDVQSLNSVLVSAVSDRRCFQAEFRLRRHDGEYRWMLDTGVPRFVGTSYIGHVGILFDITNLRQNQQQVRERLEELVNERTQQLEAANARLRQEIKERKQTEEALRENRAKLAAALASMADAVFITDAQGRLIEFNDACVAFCRFGTRNECAEIFAADPEILEVLLPDGSRAPAEMWAVPRALRGETTANTEYTLRRKDTSQTWIGSFSFGPIRGKGGLILGSVIVGRDITEQKRIEERQRHTQKLETIGVLAGGIAHDFNNLLTSILGNASMLQMDPALGPNSRLTAIIEAGDAAAALTRQLLAYAGKGRFQITDFDVSRLVRSSAELIRVSIPRNIDLQLDLPADLPLAKGDSSQIQQVIMNLVINAAEAIGGREDGRVSVSVGTQDLDTAEADRLGADVAAGRYISITVRDNGCGIDAPTKERIFDPFFTTKFTGRGLGLAAVQGILRKHKGAITVESTVGRGSTLTVYLPSTEARGADPAREAGSGAPVRPATVLVVEDEEPVRAFTQAALEMLGYQVLLAEDGRQAVNLLESHPGVDLVLLDLVMPVVGGVEAFSEMRRRWPGLPVLVVSGYSAYEARQLGIAEGVPFLEKPYTVQMLAAAVESALPSARSSVANHES
jgi:PAS domain S-box-containing protein